MQMKNAELMPQYNLHLQVELNCSNFFFEIPVSISIRMFIPLLCGHRLL